MVMKISSCDIRGAEPQFHFSMFVDFLNMCVLFFNLLYFKGSKNSRFIDRVHPGDVVQLRLDLDAGTISYAINGTRCNNYHVLQLFIEVCCSSEMYLPQFHRSVQLRNWDSKTSVDDI